MDNLGELPPGWAWARLGEVCEINPRISLDCLDSAAEIAFVPMAAVEELTNKVNVSRRRSLGEVASGFTRFAPDDILFAKITPCMENGKIAVVPDVPGDIAFGSTEFHVLRCRSGIEPLFVCHYVAQQRFRAEARGVMSGAVGQQRVPAAFLHEAAIPVPPTPEQVRITEEVRTLFASLDEAEAALGRAREALSDYRASLLHAACTGSLTAAWRTAKPHPAENGPALLRRILAERRAAWERAELARLAAKSKPAPKGDVWKSRYQEPRAPGTDGLPELPDGWVWASLDQLSTDSSYGTSVKCEVGEVGIPVLRIPNVQSGHLDWSKLKHAKADLGLSDADYLAPRDLLIVRTNGSPSLVGRAALVEDTSDRVAYFASYLIRFRLAEPPALQRWIARVFAADLIRAQVAQHAATSAGQYNISQTNLAGFAIPLPPLPELETALAELNAAELTAEGWVTNGKAHTLRQSILHAAFTGRLVPQDPADEPASALLARLRATPAAPGLKPRRARATQDALL